MPTTIYLNDDSFRTIFSENDFADLLNDYLSPEIEAHFRRRMDELNHFRQANCYEDFEWFYAASSDSEFACLDSFYEVVTLKNGHTQTLTSERDLIDLIKTHLGTDAADYYEDFLDLLNTHLFFEQIDG